MRQTNRIVARNAGIKTYESGFNCSHGHINPLRYTSSASCVECNKESYDGTLEAMTLKRAKDKVNRMNSEISFAATVKKVYSRGQTW